MAARNRLPPWHDEVRLANGRELLIRPIRPDDAVPIRAGFSLLQPDRIRHRFLQEMRELTPDLADRLTRPDPRHAFVLVAAENLPPGEALVGAVARVAAEPGSGDAEFEILVAQYIAGMGIGRQLMLRLVRWAKGKKLQRLYGRVPEENEPMLSLAESLGFQREGAAQGGLVRVVLDLEAES
ncbi:GNAT family N-acetyltransferase [Luteimonas sp. MJ293]|uniref:GNAT family N-acetyltransferase n=1 Tax=Luteimonas sp. MJ146 TaxID=3129240 RepID=UPI0031BA1AC1